MLETNEIDADFFTPDQNTSLATIFSNTLSDRNDEKKSLIYIPETPIPVGENQKIVEVHKETSASKCIFATSVSAYEWVENKYTLREKLGFAIIKDSKEEIHHLIIYTSDKTTLSLATISPKFVVNVKKDVNLSYYDNYKKYWLILSNKVSEIVKYLENLKVNMTYLTDSETTSLDNVRETVKIMDDQHPKESLDNGTDTVSSKQDKHSILKRMATMGHSVLPPSKNIVSKSTDSSDTNESDLPLLPTDKSTKSLTKRHTTEREQHNNELSKILPNMIADQDSIIPLNIEKPCYENFMHSFISENKISNSELRININRLSDKIEHLCSNSLLNQNEIVNKLLKEYESKIFAYETFIKLKGFDCNLIFRNENEGSSSVKLDSIIETADNKNQNQALKINELNEKIDILTNAFSELAAKQRDYEENLLKEIDALKEDLRDKNETLEKMNNSVQSIASNSFTEDYSNKLKNIMNTTFQTISSQFNEEENYLGSMVKSIVAKIIKKKTIESLNDIKF